VLMDSDRDSLDGLSNVFRIGQRIQKIAADLIQTIQLAAMRRIDHLDCVESRPRGRLKAPQFRHPASPCFIDCDARGKLIWSRADFGAALNSRVTSYRHEPAILSSNKAPGEGQVHDCLYILDPIAVLSYPHRPDKDCACSAAKQQGKSRHLFARCAGELFEVFVRNSIERRE